MDALRTARIGEQFEEEIGVVLVERAHAYRDDLDFSRFDNLLAELVLGES